MTGESFGAPVLGGPQPMHGATQREALPHPVVMPAEAGIQVAYAP
jgi:hypothetical protein